jgi:hypothetical protein
MLNFCGIVVAILKMVTSRNFSMSGINSGHHYLPTYQILLISDNVKFLPPIFYAVFWQTFLKWQTSRKFLKHRIFGLSRSTRCGCCSYQVSSISVRRVTCYDHFCVFQFFSILAVLKKSTLKSTTSHGIWYSYKVS